VLPHVKGLPKRALRWIAHVPEAVNFNLLLLEQAPDAESALRLAPLCGIPAQNFVVGDRRGDIGWTIMGRLPQRVGFDGRLPVSWADGQKCWDGLLAPEQYPRIFRPPGGRIWTANNRASDSSTYMALGPWDADMGARARQIRDGLAALTNAAPTDLLAIQLDHRAIFLERWQRLLLATLNQAARSNRSNGAELRQLVQGWGGQAAVDSVGYRLVRDFREHTLRLLLEPVRHLCDQAVPGLRYGAWQQESPAWVLLEQRPVHLLNPRFRSYDDLLSAAARSALADRQRRNLPLAKATWGDANRVKIQHPLSQAAPFLSRWLDIPAVSLPGDDKMPRVQGRLHGASERLVVSPGHESEGLFHMPGGQSGHFLSPFYRAGHEAWQDGKPAPFLPGPPKHRFTLTL
jgi:penicillin amidase